MDGSFPASANASGRGPARFDGAVSVRNRAAAPVRGVAAAGAEVYVTRARTIVATPVAADAVGVLVDLAPGDEQPFAAGGSLIACDGGGRLASGDYEIYAVVRVLGDGDGDELEVVGGPWPLAIT